MAHEPSRRRDPHGTRSLAPSLGGRLGARLRPDLIRSDTARRTAAVVLLLVAVALFVRDARVSSGEPVVVAAHDLAPGRVLTDADVRVVDRPGSVLPQGRVQALDDVTGRTVAAPVRGGEILTDVRVLGPRLAAAAGGSSDARVVPVRLTDTGLADVIREGDRVDVLTVRGHDTSAAPPSPSPTILASDATVVLVSPESSSGARRERIVMLALPVDAAGAVAAASLTDAITVTLH